MTEFKAVLFTIGAALVVGLATGGVLAAFHADAALMVIAFVVILWIGADAAVRVERRYDKHSQR
jgi:uncharacterized membrane protein YoaK (UPF0700 family)